MCRPFDDQAMMRIRLETNAYYLILKAIQDGNYEMVVSPVHFYEVKDIDDPYERIELTILLKRYGKTLPYQSKEIRKRAEYLCSLKFGVADATHISFAESTSDVFITCDKKLLKKYRKLKTNLLIMNPVGFCIKEDLR